MSQDIPTEPAHPSMAALLDGLNEIRRSPRNDGFLLLIACRPSMEERSVLNEGQLDVSVGLVGDNWGTRGSKRTNDGSAHPDMQLNIMNSRAADLVAGGDRSRWALAGDQLYVDLDLSADNLPPGTRLEIGSTVIEVTQQPHDGCSKFAGRFGLDALKFVNSEIGKQLHLRGVNARVITSGQVRTGDAVRKV
jgi:hypothetical protein